MDTTFDETTWKDFSLKSITMQWNEGETLKLGFATEEPEILLLIQDKQRQLNRIEIEYLYIYSLYS